MVDDAGPATRWLDDFFAAYHARRPVNASFIGIRSHDHCLPDLSEPGSADTVAEMRALLDRAPDPSSHASTFEVLDVRAATAFLELDIRENVAGHFHVRNPSHHVGEAVFGVLSLLLTEFAPLAERLAPAVARMASIPAFLDRAKGVLRDVPREWTLRALRECQGARLLFTEGVLGLADDAGLRSPALERAAAAASTAVERFARFLETELQPTTRSPAAGAELLDDCLRIGHALTDLDADGVLSLARSVRAETEPVLEERLAAQGLPDMAAAQERMARHHPAAERYLDRFAEVWDEVRGWAVAHDLVAWPDAPVRFVPRPAWVRDVAPHLYFLFYRSPAAFGRPPVHEHLVLPPVDDGVLRATNEAVIRLNHIVHHAGLGHHVQNHHAFRSASRIGRIGAVDCASRIAVYGAGTMAEGWACYATDLVAELGGLSPLEEISELHSRLRMCVRAEVDVRLHRGELSIADAANLYVRAAGMPPAAAHAEAVKNSMHPGVALMYLVGTQQIHALRRRHEPRLGLRGFHDALLSLGSLPVAEIGRWLDGNAL